MKSKSIVMFLMASQWLLGLNAQEVSFQPVAVYGWPAPGLGNGTEFAGFDCFSLADDDRVAFTASTLDAQFNRSEGLWAGLPGSLNLIANAGETAPGAGTGVTFHYFDSANIDDCQQVAFIADLQGAGVDTNNPGSFWVGAAEPSHASEPLLLVVPTNGVAGAGLEAKSYEGYCDTSGLIQCSNLVACGVYIGDANGEAIIAGPTANWVLLAREGSPAPGTTNKFGNIAGYSDMKSLAPDGRIAFPDGLANGGSGVWFGAPGALQPVAVPGQPAPSSLPGGPYTYSSFDGQEVEANGHGDLAFVMSADGSTNSADLLLAGPPGGLRVVAQSGQPAPGIPGAIFTSVNAIYGNNSGIFGDVVLGSDGSVAFVASYSTNGNDYGLWFARSNGTPQLIAHTGGQAPGTASGVVFAPPYQYLPPFDEFYMNSQDQIVFHASLAGTGVGSTNSSGIWLVQPDGTVSLLARAGETVGGYQLGSLSLGYEFYLSPNVAGPEDGRRSPINSRGDVLFWASETPVGSYISGEGLFLARNGLILNATVARSKVYVSFPTLSGKHYREDYKSDLTAPTWSVAVQSVTGTGGEVTVTNPPTSSAAFYRVVRVD